MFELLAGLLGAGGSIAGGLLGADAAEDANNKNWQINLMNYYARERERNDKIQAAQKSDADRKKGYMDANGNRIAWDPVTGWTTTLSASGKQIQDAQNSETMKTLYQDLPAKRQQMFRNLSDQQDDRYYADGAMDAYKRSGELPYEAAARARTNAQAGTNQQWDNITNSIMRDAVRMGSSNVGQILKDVIKGRARDVGIAGADAAMRGEAQGAAADQQRRGTMLNIAQAFGSRARGMPQVVYKPTDFAKDTDPLLRQGAQLDARSGSELIDAMGKQGGTLDYTQPNMGYAAAISGGGQALGSMFSNLGSYYDKRQAMGNSGFSGTGGLY